MLKNIAQYMLLRPHAERLLMSSGKFYFASATALMLAMATAEATAWSYLGYLFGTGGTRWVTAAFAGGMMFAVVWIVDTSLLTLDRAWIEHARTILGVKTPSPRKAMLRDGLRFGMRIGLLLASLTVTSPYLAQVVFHKDIEAMLNSRAVESLDAARDKLTTKYNGPIFALEKQIADERIAYENEVAGKGTSGRYGAGPAAQAMLGDIGKNEQERDSRKRERDAALAKFNSLAQNWQSNRDQLAALYTVSLPNTSISENRMALDELRKRPENQATELAIKVFLSIVFGGLLLLKLFEPSSVRLYLSDVLQQEFLRYLAGVFDPMLPTSEQSTHPRSVMPPQRFYEFLTRVWVPANSHPRTVEAAKSLALLEGMRVQINVEVEQARTEVERVCSVANDTGRSLIELKSAVSSVGADLAQFRQDMNAISSENTPLDPKARMEYQSYLRAKIQKADLTLHELQEAIPSETERHNRACQAVLQVEGRLRNRQAELMNTQEKIQEVRSHLSVFVGNAAGAALGATSAW